MSLNSPISVVDYYNISKYPEINDVIIKEKEILLLANQYNTIQKEYSDELQKSMPSEEVLNKLLSYLNEINTRLMQYSDDINSIKDVRMDNFRKSILDKKQDLNDNIFKILNELSDEEVNLSSMKKRISDAVGINNEYEKKIKSANYKYLVLWFIVFFLVFSIIFSLTLPYKTSLEFYLFVILCLVVLYYLYYYYVHNAHVIKSDMKKQVGNINYFLNL